MELAWVSIRNSGLLFIDYHRLLITKFLEGDWILVLLPLKGVVSKLLLEYLSLHFMKVTVSKL